jgi:hypothetical protein
MLILKGVYLIIHPCEKFQIKENTDTLNYI